MIAIFYLLVWRPQARERKRLSEWISGMKKGDEVVTQSGIIGTVYLVEDRVVTLDVGGGNKLRVLKSQVVSAWKQGEPAASGQGGGEEVDGTVLVVARRADRGGRASLGVAARPELSSTSGCRPTSGTPRSTRSRCPAFPLSPGPNTRLNLGLDLQGGILLDMGVDVDRAVKAKITRVADSGGRRAQGEEGIAYESVTTAGGNGTRVEVKTADPGGVQNRCSRSSSAT